MKRPIKATRDRAATLARLVASGKVSASGLSREGGQSQPVAVRITNSIAAGDSGLKDATLMELVGGVLTDTKQPIKVRHVGESAVAAGTVVTPEWCGKLGLCFTRSVEVVQSAFLQYRPLKLDGPITAEGGVVADYTSAWGFGPWFTRMLDYRPTGWASSGYFAECDFSTVPNGVKETGYFVWIKNMQPIRFSIQSYDGEFCRELYDRQISGVPNYVLNPLAIGEASGLGVTGHLSPVKISSIGRAGAGVMRTGGRSEESIFQKYEYKVTTPEQGTPISGRTYYSQLFIAYSRLWIDGVDVTGIKTGNLPKTVDPLEYLGKTCQIDLWCRYVTRLSDRGASGETIPANGTLQAVRQIGWIDPANNGFPCILGSYDYSNAITVTGTRFTLAFDQAGPFGLSSLLMDTGDGWTLNTWNNTQSLTKTTGTPGTSGAKRRTITLNWMESDRPLLTYLIEDWTITTAFANIQETWHYRPEPSAGFVGTLCPSGVTAKAGAWDPSVASDFILVAAFIPINGSSRVELRDSGENIIPKLRWQTPPQIITVTKV